MDRKIIDDLAAKLVDSVPGDLSNLRRDMEENFRGLLASGLGKLDLVTREEFEVQRKVLERTREKLDKLDAELANLQRRADPERGEG